MQVQRLILGMFETNCYILSGETEGRCIVIDPAEDAAQITSYMRKQNLTLEAVLLTHGHYDHFMAVPNLQKEDVKLPIYCHSLDCPKEKEEFDVDMRRTFPTVTAFSNVKQLQDKQELELAGIKIKVIHTPGHTPGSVIFITKDSIFTGDTLFCGSIGRTDFPGGNEAQMAKSLKRIAAIKGNYRVYPGHEGITTLEQEKKSNYYLK